MRLTPSNKSAFTAPTGYVVAEMAIDGLLFFVVDETPEAFNLSPKSLDGTKPYGLRQGRTLILMAITG
jgi:hypothetical protein